MFHKIIGFRSHGGFPFSAPVLAGIEGNRISLDIPASADCHNHVFFCNKIFDADLGRAFNNLGPSFITKFLIQFFQLIFD